MALPRITSPHATGNQRGALINPGLNQPLHFVELDQVLERS